ncbi:hypothetical protein NXT3_PC00825 (plasmid) [Sinorhizobium fredii]|uniref:Uncharacterized protein n=1 Tax=Rhizobium fredii TaxID=380 RepID=A0A2L0HEU0_RHIFR|nr:hypothetical protein NXT3_PC00825 [Sinorhizobium fredii]
MTNLSDAAFRTAFRRFPMRFIAPVWFNMTHVVNMKNGAPIFAHLQPIDYT